MLTFTTIVLLVAGVWLVSTSLIMWTTGFLVGMFFKVIPFFLGISCLLACAVEIGWVTL